MPHWADGYPVAQGYLDTVQADTAPDQIDLSLIVAGRRPPRDGDRFRYAELGCGSAFSLIALAACHPNAEFVGYDFMPEHVSRAAELIAEAGLDNVEVREASFGELVSQAAPEPFHYIVSHGVFTWVSAENQAHIVTLLNRWLKAGGVAYLGYSSAAGWATMGPIRQIFREAPAGPPDSPFAPARKAVETWLEAGAPPQARRHWERLKRLPDLYLGHDLAAQHGTALWPAELSARLAPAKLDFVAQAALAEQFDALRFSGAQLEFVSTAAREGWGEAARDLISERTFRTELYVRGAPRLTAAQSYARLGERYIEAWPPILEHEVAVRRARSGNGLTGDVAQKVEKALGSGPQTIAQFVQSVGMEPRQAMQSALIALATDQAMAIRNPDNLSGPAAEKFHHALARRWREGVAVPGVLAPRLARAVMLSHEEKRVLFGRQDSGEDIRQAFARLGLPGFGPANPMSQERRHA